jgi:uncharacterized protein (UPF0335 family)
VSSSITGGRFASIGICGSILRTSNCFAMNATSEKEATTLRTGGAPTAPPTTTGETTIPRKPKPPTPAPIGHNSLDRDRLKSLVERIESIEEQKAELASDIRDVYAEAKSAGLDAKALRKVIRLRRQDSAERDALQSAIDEYLSALGDLADLPLGRAALARDGLAPPV